MALVTYARQGLFARRLFWDVARDPNLVGLWLLNETSGTTAYDRCTKNLINGTLTNTPTLDVALGNGFNGMTFSAASSQYVSLGSPSGLGFARTDPFSIICLATQNDNAAVKALISRFTSGGPNNQGWIFFFDAGEKLLFQFWRVGENINVTSNAALSTGTLIMPGCSYSGSGAASGVVLYNNGVAVADTDTTDTLTGTVDYTNATASIAAYDVNTGPHDGSIGLIAIFDAAKSAADFRRWASLAGLLA